MGPGAPVDTWISPKLEVRDSPVHGNGTFAVAAIETGELLEVWGQRWEGHPTVSYTADRDAVQRARADGRIVMQWDADLYSIETPGADPGYFINHSCDPNVWFRDSFSLIARRPIGAGDEVTLDYALMESEPSFVAAWRCRCGSFRCRGVVTGRDWRDHDLQHRYEGHFIPLLNKRIAARP